MWERCSAWELEIEIIMKWFGKVIALTHNDRVVTREWNWRRFNWLFHFNRKMCGFTLEQDESSLFGKIDCPNWFQCDAKSDDDFESFCIEIFGCLNRVHTFHHSSSSHHHRLTVKLRNIEFVHFLIFIETHLKSGMGSFSGMKSIMCLFLCSTQPEPQTTDSHDFSPTQQQSQWNN